MRERRETWREWEEEGGEERGVGGKGGARRDRFYLWFSHNYIIINTISCLFCVAMYGPSKTNKNTCHNCLPLLKLN